MKLNATFFITLSSLLLLCGTAGAVGEKDIDACYEDAVSQMELNVCSGLTYQAANDELQRVSAQIQKTYSGDPLFLEKLKRSQEAWENYRDAQFAMKYPHEATKHPRYYGSVFPMCANLYMRELILERVGQLNVWLEGIEEGDVCSGSVRTSEQLKE